MISFPFIKKAPHTLAPPNLVVKFPRDPKVAAAPTKIVKQLGTMGIKVSGLFFYGVTEGPIPTELAWATRTTTKCWTRAVAMPSHKTNTTTM
jgi:hypothetical protein